MYTYNNNKRLIKMNSTNTKIELISQNLGTLTFENQYAAEGDFFYQAMILFEVNNGPAIGEYSYKLYTTWEDGSETVTEYEGINASALLACHFDSEHAEQLDNFIQSQY